MKTVELKAKIREGKGTRGAKKVRSSGLIPGVIYGAGKETCSIQMDRKDLELILNKQAGGNVVINLKIEGGNNETVFINEIQRDPVTTEIRHIDFHIISMTEKIEAEVPIHTKGEAVGVKDGGVLDLVHRTVTVECLPTEIPDRLNIAIDQLKINDAIHIKELNLPEGVICALDPEEVILKVLPPRKEEEVAPPEGEAGAEPEVITAKKEEAPEGEAAPEKKPEKKKE